MKVIGFEREREATQWAAETLGCPDFGFCRAYSAVDAEDNFALVIVLSNFTKTNIDMHTAAQPGRQWATPKSIVQMFNGVFHYVFTSHLVDRVTGLVPADNADARRFDEHLGFTLEGTMREACDGKDLCIYGFLRDEFENHKWYRSIK